MEGVCERTDRAERTELIEEERERGREWDSEPARERGRPARERDDLPGYSTSSTGSARPDWEKGSTAWEGGAASD